MPPRHPGQSSFSAPPAHSPRRTLACLAARLLTRLPSRLTPACPCVAFALAAARLCAQAPSTLPTDPAPVIAPGQPAITPGQPPPAPPPPPLVFPAEAASSPSPAALPDAPGESSIEIVAAAHDAFEQTGDLPRPRFRTDPPPLWRRDAHPGLMRRIQLRRARYLNPYQRFLDTQVRIPMSPAHKAYIAATNVIDPGGLLTLTGGSAYFVATTPQSAYGPGLKGFGRNVGYSLLGNTTGEFFGTFLIPTLTHQDIRYYRMPDATLRRRILHAVSHTVITSSDTGAPMPNYATLLTYPITAVLANLYVPGVRTNAPSTASRVGLGLATDPSGALLDEFLPDIGKRIHIRILFFQQIINQVSAQPPL